MPDLFLHHRKINTVFDLLGDKENDITYSIGWALSRCGSFLRSFVKEVLPEIDIVDDVSICLQEHTDDDGGYTDIEIQMPHTHIVVEAKRGWNLPSDEQLNKYAPRLVGRENRVIVVAAECTLEYVQSRRLPQSIQGIPVRYMSWRKIYTIACCATDRHKEKHLLDELRHYLEGLMSMQNQKSNLVYVVSLGAGTPSFATISWQDIVEKGKKYFHPFGVEGWPKEPPNYLGFRYNGRLQSIRHIEHYEIFDDVRKIKIQGIDSGLWQTENEEAHRLYDRIVYDLGPAVLPMHEVKTGKIYPNGKVWAVIDLLLTCNTISEARDRTQERFKDSSIGLI